MANLIKQATCLTKALLKKYGTPIFIFMQIDMMLINLFFLYLSYEGFQCMSNRAKLQKNYEQYLITVPPISKAPTVSKKNIVGKDNQKTGGK